MSKIDRCVRLTADNNGETKCIIFTSDMSDARTSLEQYTSRIVGAYPFISGFGVFINVHKLEDLVKLDCVRAVASHSTVLTTEDKAEPISPAAFSHIDYVWNTGNYGQNITCAVIDTGINPHIDFMLPTKRIAAFKDFTADTFNMYDDNGHGTAVAGIMCGNGLLSNRLYSGVAPKANLISLKAIANSGEGSAFAILEAMQWVYENKDKYNIKVLCLSFGSPPQKNDPLQLGAEALWRKGITVVTSAGNSGPKPNSINSPGISNVVITVGAINKDFNVPDYSSRGSGGKYSKPDLCAIGNCAAPSSNSYAVFSGTSMSAPIVAGMCALILKKYPDYTPDKIKQTLIDNAVKLNCSIDDCGAGLASVEFLTIND